MKYLKLQTLTKGWHDRDEILLHACFQVLVDFMEQERPDRIDWNVDRLQKGAWKEIKSLYNWWKRIRPARRSPLLDKKLAAPTMKWRKIPSSHHFEMVEPDSKKYAKYYQALKKQCRLQQKWFEEDQRNLHRLVEVREYLWT